MHTPGPWTVRNYPANETEGDDAETHIQAYADENGEEGASLAWVNRWTFGDSPPAAESVANARLIAAAPELLAALEELSAYSASDVDANEASFEQAREHARAAIAKATA